MKLSVVSLYGDLRYVPPMKGLRRFGVPPGGPFDAESASLAAAITRSSLASVVELAFGEATFAVEEDGTIGIVGPGGGERRSLTEGEEITLAPRDGARLAIAAVGGWSVPRLGIDPDVSLAIRVGDSLVAESTLTGETRRLYRPLSPEPIRTIRVVTGPQHEFWTNAGLMFPVSSLLDRRGVRLGAAPEHSHEIASEPCVPGVVQWTPSGELIVLGPDGPTIGGYPKPFVVIRTDLPIVGQLRPGDAVRLAPTDPDAARRIEGEARAELARRTTMIRLAG